MAMTFDELLEYTELLERRLRDVWKHIEERYPPVLVLGTKDLSALGCIMPGAIWVTNESEEIARLRTEVARLKEASSRRLDMLELAWGVIANANGGNWDSAAATWRGAAERWRDSYFEEMRAALSPAPSEPKATKCLCDFACPPGEFDPRCEHPKHRAPSESERSGRCPEIFGNGIGCELREGHEGPHSDRIPRSGER